METGIAANGRVDRSVRPLCEEQDIERLRADVEFLWSIIDDIDTASDMAKGNNVFYRARVEQLQSKRHQRVTTDGYGLFVVPLCRNDGRCQYAIDHGAEGMGHCPPGKCCMPNVEFSGEGKRSLTDSAGT